LESYKEILITENTWINCLWDAVRFGL
jgi:hypothetical protein